MRPKQEALSDPQDASPPHCEKCGVAGGPKGELLSTFLSEGRWYCYDTRACFQRQTSREANPDEAERLRAWIVLMRDISFGSDVPKNIGLMTKKALDGEPASEFGYSLLRVYRARVSQSGSEHRSGSPAPSPGSSPAGSVDALGPVTSLRGASPRCEMCGIPLDRDIVASAYFCSVACWERHSRRTGEVKERSKPPEPEPVLNGGVGDFCCYECVLECVGQPYAEVDGLPFCCKEHFDKHYSANKEDLETK